MKYKNKLTYGKINIYIYIYIQINMGTYLKVRICV